MKYIFLFLFFCSQAFAVSDIFGVLSQGQATATTSASQILSQNLNRKYLIIQNTGSTTVTVNLGVAQSGGAGIQIIAGGNYEPVHTPTDSIWIQSTSSTDVINYIEGE
jgi:hypothetical protein